MPDYILCPECKSKKIKRLYDHLDLLKCLECGNEFDHRPEIKREVVKFVRYKYQNRDRKEAYKPFV